MPPSGVAANPVAPTNVRNLRRCIPPMGAIETIRFSHPLTGEPGFDAAKQPGANPHYSTIKGFGIVLRLESHCRPSRRAVHGKIPWGGFADVALYAGARRGTAMMITATLS